MTIPQTPENTDKAVTLRVRGGDGRLRQSLTSAQRDAEAARLYSLGYTYQQIADALGLYGRGDAHKIVKRAMSRVPVPAVEQLRKRHDGILDRLLAKALQIMERDHLAHSQGRIVRAGCPGPGHPGHFEYGERTNRHGDTISCEGEPVLDDGPKLQAITVARGLLERSAKLHGLDAPVRTSIEGDELVIRIKGVDTDAV